MDAAFSGPDSMGGFCARSDCSRFGGRGLSAIWSGSGARGRGLNASLICWRGSVISEGEEFGFASERRLESPRKG